MFKADLTIEKKKRQSLIPGVVLTNYFFEFYTIRKSGYLLTNVYTCGKTRPMIAVLDPKTEQITAWLKETFKPTRLFLYGSRANGTARVDSDYDFVMVLPEFDRKNRIDLMMSIQGRAFEKLGVEVQVWTYSEVDFNDWKDEFSSIPETALNTGVEITLG